MDWLENITIPNDLVNTPTSPTAPENSNFNIDKANEPIQNIGEPVKTPKHNLPSMAINEKTKDPYGKRPRLRSHPLQVTPQTPLLSTISPTKKT